MQTEITLNESELNVDFLKKIKAFLKLQKSARITIKISDEDSYSDSLRESIREIETGKNLITFSADEFNSYVAQQTR